ncbi:hypothetical protein BDV96DRAFT_648178 [Lophiotrema nucula]|uniref:Uncharacterized protein n=1 Tax=Lophiotrema nucula TaxID=690887 RepID=A0A6A5Z2W7_9PLEO|nr:hypothetical protein BDV96DRAFT_648178 [Lophiotrema nucula]
MYSLLSQATQPTTSQGDNVEDLFLTGAEAEARLQPGIPLDGPIVTNGQQQFQCNIQKGQPIEQLFRRMGNLDRTVSVQNPSFSLEGASSVKMRLGDVQDILLSDRISEDPINALELRSPLPRSILPRFLNGEDCQLLGRVRDAVLDGDSGERCAVSIAEWNRWKDVEDWALLA